jgi:hypothetical protein
VRPRSMVRTGPVVRATEDPPRSPPTSRHLTSPLTVPRELRRCWLAWRLPPTRSHGGSQGFKSPHLHPQPCRSERRQRRVGGAHCRLRPQRGRNLKSQCSPEPLRGQPTQAQASHDDHAAWSPLAASRWAILARNPASPVGHRSTWPSAKRRRPSPSRPSAGPARPAPASSARLQPRADDAPSWTWRATTPTPSISSRTAAGPTATPRYLIAVGHRGHRDAQTPNAGHWTPGRSDARTGHRTPVPWTGKRGHWSLAPDTGHRTLDTGRWPRTWTG